MKTIYQVDAFTEEPFKGNPAGVMIVDKNFSEELMQNIALEMNLSETAFIIPEKDKFLIRFFTPTKEIPLCGHATIAGSHIIYELGLKKTNEMIKFKAIGGKLTVSKNGDWIKMDFPKYSFKKIPTPPLFKKIIGFEPIEVYSSDDDWVIAIAKYDIDVLNAKPNYELMKDTDFGYLMITAKSTSYKADFVVRCFVPMFGINEDPVTGSAHCALAPLWAERLNKVELESLQLSNRTGKLKLKLMNEKVEISGKAITIFEAKMKI